MIPVYRKTLERMAHWYHVQRTKLDLGLHKFVRDGEDDTRRMARRFHIHMCLFGCAGLVETFGGPMLGVYGLGGVSLASLALTEAIDRIGKF
jgi:hypothetical protein